MYLLEPKGGGGGRSVGLLYCLSLSAWYFMNYDTVTNRVDHLAVAYLLEAKEGGGGRRVGLFYCLLLSAWYFMIQSQIEWIILLWRIS
jgi:hypothetical protein